MHFLGFLSILLLFNVVSYAAPAANTPIQVNLRIEGAQTTLFEGTVTTSGHDVTTPSGGTHECDGLNSGANSQPGATPFTALADGAQQNGFTFDGLWEDVFNDFIIGTIAGEFSGGSTIWTGAVDFLEQGIITGCHKEISGGDQVVFALTDDSTSPIFLKLQGPTTAKVNHPVTFSVIDGFFLTRIQGAQVNGHATDANGNVMITFAQPGQVSLKASKVGGFVRSNRLDIQVTN
ncbi:hypothetical protein CVT26_014619 [Gymnopilus dilepis]|uniref:Uncharacterized protein n=1 Tax=Gymnopilus dilepis TaxID=231916 RepID=A0A409VWT1_9AGAR|nr:hypothetical protein CVT26_014619 [Gymnopilus dilepis]